MLINNIPIKTANVKEKVRHFYFALTNAQCACQGKVKMSYCLAKLKCPN